MDSTEKAIEIGGTGESSETVTVKVIYESDGEYYLLVDGKYYAITPSDTNGLEVANEPSDIGPIDDDDRNESITVSATGDNIVNATVSGKTITIEGKNSGTSVITVKVNDVEYTNNKITVAVKKLSELIGINVETSDASPLVIDGASLITATISDESSNQKIATSSDVKWSVKNAEDSNKVSVTSNGIVKCGTATGKATIVCTGANNTTKEAVVESKAKIVYTNSGNANSTVTGKTGSEADFSYNNPVIPVGFSAIDTVAAKWNLSEDKKTASPEYNKGLVIMDNNGNQFVWVPVDGTTITYEKWDGTKNYRTVSQCEDDTLSDGTTISSIDTQANYGGFWIGRYEAGLDVDMDSNAQTNADSSYRSVDTAKSIPIIVEGAIPWNRITYTNSQKNAEKMYPATNQNVRSGLINGTQWDTAIKFIQLLGGKNDDANSQGVKSDSTKWGNYSDAELNLDNYKMYSTDYGASWISQNVTKKTKNDSQLLRTGASKTTEVLNISDMAGNVWEWTNEKLKDSSGFIYMGGSYYYSGIPATYRNSISDTASIDVRF